jgi:hypothetical protein
MNTIGQLIAVLQIRLVPIMGADLTTSEMKRTGLRKNSCVSNTCLCLTTRSRGYSRSAPGPMLPRELVAPREDRQNIGERDRHAEHHEGDFQRYAAPAENIAFIVVEPKRLVSDPHINKP